MTNNLKITVLGTGTSVGIPALGKLGWGKCDPSNPKNKRQRCSLLVQNNDTNILISAHGNSIRALCKYLFNLDNDVISKLEIPTGNPLLIEVNGDKKVLNAKYLDSDRAKDLLVF